MRVIAGRFRGLRLATVGKGDPGAHLRPTADRVRESLFNVLSSGGFGDVLTGAHVLDLFAGTGALGIEALSRGAAQVTFVDNGRAAAKLVAANIGLTGAESECRLLRCDASRLGPVSGPPASLIFLDPPYGKSLGERALHSARASGWIAPGAVVLWEEASPQLAPDGFNLLQHRRYGDTHISFLEYSSDLPVSRE